MSTPFDIVVMGDINLDWCSRGELSFPFSQLVTNGVIEWAPIDELPGGSGLNFARFAKEMGYTPLLLGKIGDDPAGRFIQEELGRHGLASGVTQTDGMDTGKAFISRDRHGIRFLVNNTPNANQALSPADVERYAGALAACDVLYVSGYCVMHPDAPRKQATLTAMQLARRGAHTHIVFDVVPHQMYKIYDFPQFRGLTEAVDILISEVATMRRFLGLGHKDEEITRAMAEATAERLAAFFDRFMLRFGPSGCDQQVTWDAPSQSMVHEETGHDLAEDKRGFGDRLALKTLQEVFDLAPKR